MSLINDALRKARLEASRKQVGQRDRPLPSYWNSPGLKPALQLSTVTVVLLALALVAVAVVSTVAILQLRTSESGPALADEAAPGTTGSGAMPTVSELVAEPSGTVVEATPGDLKLSGTASADSIRTTPTAEPVEVREPRQNQQSGEPPARRAATAAAGGDQRRPPAPPTTPSTDGTSTGSEATASEPVVARTASPDRPSEQTTSPPTPVEAEAPTPSEPVVAEPPKAEPAAAEVAADDTERAAQGVEEEAGGDATIDSFVREAEIAGGGVYRLDGIAWSSDQPFALVNGQVVGAGGFVDGAAVSEVLKDRVVLLRDEYRFELRLR